MQQRKPIGKKLRFEVFKRDSFSCQYCGSKPPSVVLEVDHIVPVKMGGNNSINNLATSCFNCNRGKSANPLTSIPNSMVIDMEIVKEKNAQFKAYVKVLNEQAKMQNEIYDYIGDIYTSFFTRYELSKNFKEGTLKKFIYELGHIEVGEAMRKSCSYVDDSSGAIKYFCGICWNKIKNKNDDN